MAAAALTGDGHPGSSRIGHLSNAKTNRLWRNKLFIITVVLYLVATVLTAFSMNPLWFYACRFFTGAGIGGEYAAINSAIDELIPARTRAGSTCHQRLVLARDDVRGRPVAGAADKDPFSANLGWRIAFGLGAVLGLGILLVRRNVPESPHWLFIHGHNDRPSSWSATSSGRSSARPGSGWTRSATPSGSASAAYLTGSEIFPMETRAMALAFFTPSARASAGSPGRPCSASWSRPRR